MSNAATAHVSVAPKKGNAWDGFLRKARGEHWRKIQVTIRFREKMHAGKPAQLDAANAMLRARGLEDAIEAVDVSNPVELAEAAETVVNEGLCEFLRREGKPGIWFPANNLKAMLKENFGVLGYRMDARPPSAKDKAAKRAAEKTEGAEVPAGKGVKGGRGAMAEGLFVVSTDPNDLDYIHLGEKPDGIDQSVAHTMGPKGPQASIKRNEYVLHKTIAFQIWIAKADAVASKIFDETLADVLVHAEEHGTGANRSQGLGRFDVVSIEDVE